MPWQAGGKEAAERFSAEPTSMFDDQEPLAHCHCIGAWLRRQTGWRLPSTWARRGTNDATVWLSQWPIWALVVLLVTVFYAGRLAQRVGGLEGRLEQGLARLEARIETLFGELRENRPDVSKAQADVADVRERVSALEASG